MRSCAVGGFTLIEVMIVVAMVAVLTAIAVPSYNEYIIRGRIPDATSGLAIKQVQLEQFFQDNRSYVGSDANINGPCFSDTRNRNFDFSCTVLGATSYTLRAEGKGLMVGFAFTVDQANQRATASVPAGWMPPLPNNCWVTRKSGLC